MSAAAAPSPLRPTLGAGVPGVFEHVEVASRRVVFLLFQTRPGQSLPLVLGDSKKNHNVLQLRGTHSTHPRGLAPGVRLTGKLAGGAGGPAKVAKFGEDSVDI